MGYDKETKIETVAYALATSYSKASEKYGPSKSTISSWRKKFEDQADPDDYGFDVDQTNTNSNRSNGVSNSSASKKLQNMADEAKERTIEEIKEKMADDVEQLSTEMLDTAWDAVDEINKLINSGKEDADKDKWLKAVVGAMDYLVENSNLLSGKPTERKEQTGEVTKTEKYEIKIEQLKEQAQNDPETARAIRNIKNRLNSGERSKS